MGSLDKQIYRTPTPSIVAYSVCPELPKATPASRHRRVAQRTSAQSVPGLLRKTRGRAIHSLANHGPATDAWMDDVVARPSLQRCLIEVRTDDGLIAAAEAKRWQGSCHMQRPRAHAGSGGAPSSPTKGLGLPADLSWEAAVAKPQDGSPMRLARGAESWHLPRKQLRRSGQSTATPDE